jgi:GNAT superfamily N-acetyltransferase
MNLIIEHRRGQYLISTDKSKLDLGVIHQFLSTESYWAQGRTMETVRASVEASWCFGVYDGERQVGFARVVTDGATFAWVCDVFIVQDSRGRGLSKWLVESVVASLDQAGVRRILLATRDAHELYRRYGGFDSLQAPDRWLERRRP